MSATQLKRVMGFASYETAWAHPHKLRRAMVRPGRELLSGLVEVDEGYVGGREVGVDGRHSDEKSPVLVAVEVRYGQTGETAGRIRLSRVEPLTKVGIEAFITDAVKSSAAVRTDAGTSTKACRGLATSTTRSRSHIRASRRPRRRPMSRGSSPCWLLGTHQGSVQAHQLDYYLDEFTFLLNRRHSRHFGLLFYRLLEEAVATEPTPLNSIIGGNGGRSGINRHHH
jgi:hypothetical protein